MNRHDAALAAAERALALSPQTTQAHLAKANALLGMERDRDALAALEAATRSDPKNGEIHVEIGDVLWRNLQAPEPAFDHYRTATNLAPALAAAHVRIADYHLRRGDTNAAQPVLALLRRIAPKSPDLLVLDSRWRNQAAAP
jgi:tetratricopeptide (TPR) repeat protein